MKNRSELREGFELLLDALEAETSAMTDKTTSNTDRETAQVAVLDIMHRLQRDTGLLDMLQRRLVVLMQDKETGTPVKATALPVAQKDYYEEAGERRLRAVVRGVILDSAYLPEPVASYIGAKTRNPSQGYDMGGGLGPLSEPVPHPGRNRMDGIKGSMADLLINAMGYTTGYEGMPTTHRLTTDIYERAQVMARHAMTSRGFAPAPEYIPTRAALKKWANITRKRDFETAYQRGRADKAAGREPQAGCLLPKTES